MLQRGVLTKGPCPSPSGYRTKNTETKKTILYNGRMCLLLRQCYFHSHPNLDLNILVTGRGRFPNYAAQALASFLSESRWAFSPTANGREHRGCRLVLIELLSIHGFFPGRLISMSGISASSLISWFRSCFVKLTQSP